MTFQESVKTCLNKYADFNGVASRSEYWWFALFCFLVSIVAAGIAKGVGNWFEWVASLALFLPSLAVAVRRLRDVGRSPWWLLINFVPIVGTIVLIIFLVQPSKYSYYDERM